MECPALTELPSPPPGKTGWPWKDKRPRLPRVMPGGSPWPRVSIVTPSYNQGQFIEETIRSVLLQGYPNLEYLIVDGGSEDNSVEIIRKYEPWLSYWVSEPDEGQSHAINRGFRHATGDILAWLNSDDIYLPHALHSRARHLVDHARDDLVYSGCMVIDRNGRKVSAVSAPPFCLTKLLLGNYVFQPTVFLRRSVLDRIGYLDASLQYVMDYEFWLRAATSGLRINCVSGCHAGFRHHDAAKSTEQEYRFWSEIAGVFDNLFAGRDLPAEVYEVKRRAYARLHWRTALSLQSIGSLPEAKCHSTLAVDRYDLCQSNEDIDHAIYWAIRGTDGEFLAPSEMKARFRDLDSNSSAYSQLERRAASRYRLWWTIDQYAGKRATKVLSSLRRAVYTAYQRLATTERSV